MLHRRREARARRRRHRLELRRARTTERPVQRETKSRAMQRAFKGIVTPAASRILNGLAAGRWARHAAASRAQGRQEPFDPADLLPVYRDPQARRNARRKRHEEAAA